MLTAHREAVVLLGHREPEAADLREARHDLLGDVGVGPVHVLGDGSDLVGREAVEGLAHQVELVVEVGGPGSFRDEVRGDLLEEDRGSVRLDERQRALEVRAVDTPDAGAGEQPRSQVHERIGDERPCEHRLVLAVRRVVEHHAAALDGARRVREVVREHLVLVELRDGDAVAVGARVGEVATRRVDDGLRVVDCGCRGVHHVDHGRRA